MDIVSENCAVHDPIAASRTTSDDRVLLSHWMPPQSGIIPVT